MNFTRNFTISFEQLNRDSKKDESRTPLCPPGNRQPSVLNMNDEIFILGKDNHSIYVDTNGNPASLKQMKWDSVPRDLGTYFGAKFLQKKQNILYFFVRVLLNQFHIIFFFLVYDEPYLVALFPESVEIRTVEPSLIIQTHPLEESRIVVRCRSGLLYIASYSYVWCLQNITWSRQIHFLLEQKQFQLALKIAVGLNTWIWALVSQSVHIPNFFIHCHFF